MTDSYHFDLYPRTDPLGARLVRFTNLQTAEWRGEANGTGSGSFTIRTDNPDAAFIDPTKLLEYVRVVRVDDLVVDGATLSGFDELVVGGFFLERAKHKVLDDDETKLLEVGGAGPLSVFQRAVMDFDSWIDDPFIGTDPQPEGVWPLYLAGTGNELGAILWRVLHELEEPGRHQDPIPFLSLGFTHLVDSNAAAWVRTTGDFSAQVGENVISIVRRLMEMGLYVEVDPDTFEVRAFEPETHRRDVTGGSWGAGVVRFQAPIGGDISTGSIKSDLTRAPEASVRRNAILTGAKDTWEWVVDGSVDVPWESTYIVDDESGTSLNDAGSAQLGLRSDAGDPARLRMKLGDDPDNGRYRPFESDGVLLDDIVSLHTGTGPWDYDETEYPVAALTISLRPGGDWDCWVDLGANYTSTLARDFQAKAGGQCNCPELCRPGSTPAFVRGAGSASGIAGGFTALGAVGETMYAFILERAGFPTTVCRWDPDDIALPDQDFTFLSRVTNGDSIVAVYRLLAPGLGPGQVECSIGTGSVYMGAHHVIGRVSEVVTTNSGSSGASSVTAAASGGQIIVDAAGLTLFSVGGSPAPPTPGGGQTQDWALSTGTTDSVEWGGSHFGNNPTWTWDTAAPWAAAAVVVAGGGSTADLPQPVGANDEAAVGTSIRAARCDHVHPHSDLSDHNDEIHHHADSIEGLTAGAPTAADYLVGTAQAGLSAEIVVGTTPGGELGNTWASPTVDATHAGSNHLQPVRKNSAGTVFERRRLNLIEGSNVTLTVADDSGNDEVDITVAATGTGSGGPPGSVSPWWWHSDNAPASPDAANDEFSDGTIPSATRVQGVGDRGDYTEAYDGLVWTAKATGSNPELDVFCVPRTMSIGDHITVAGNWPMVWGNVLGLFVGMSDGTTVSTSKVVGMGSWIPGAGGQSVCINNWTGFNTRTADGPQETLRNDGGSHIYGFRFKYEAANTWGYYLRFHSGGPWRRVTNSYAMTITPTHVVFGVTMMLGSTYTANAGQSVRLECVRVND